MDGKYGDKGQNYEQLNEFVWLLYFEDENSLLFGIVAAFYLSFFGVASHTKSRMQANDSISIEDRCDDAEKSSTTVNHTAISGLRFGHFHQIRNVYWQICGIPRIRAVSIPGIGFKQFESEWETIGTWQRLESIQRKGEEQAILFHYASA